VLNRYTSWSVAGDLTEEGEIEAASFATDDLHIVSLLLRLFESIAVAFSPLMAMNVSLYLRQPTLR
jgi:hypothetical protein